MTSCKADNSTVNVLQCNQVADMSSAVYMANYEALDRCICDQIITDAVANRVGKVDNDLLMFYCSSIIYLIYPLF